MGTIRVARRKRWTSISNETIDDARLSFRARGILTWLLAKPDGWRTDGRAIANNSDKEGRDAVYTALGELEAIGYLHRTRTRDPLTGQWGWDSVVHEHPVAPDPGNQDDDTGPDAGGCPVEPNPDNQDPADQDPGNQDSSTKDPDRGTETTPPPPAQRRRARTTDELRAEQEAQTAVAQAAKRERDMETIAAIDAEHDQRADPTSHLAEARRRLRGGAPIVSVPDLQEVRP